MPSLVSSVCLETCQKGVNNNSELYASDCQCTLENVCVMVGEPCEDAKSYFK